jgi:hypothetical protein
VPEFARDWKFSNSLSLGISIASAQVLMTDLMNLGFLLLTFGLAIGFVLACERLK